MALAYNICVPFGGAAHDDGKNRELFGAPVHDDGKKREQISV